MVLLLLFFFLFDVLLTFSYCSFCVICEKDPRTCETNYRAPMLKETSESCVEPVEKFAKLLLEITDTCSLPLIMVNQCLVLLSFIG